MYREFAEVGLLCWPQSNICTIELLLTEQYKTEEQRANLVEKAEKIVGELKSDLIRSKQSDKRSIKIIKRDEDVTYTLLTQAISYGGKQNESAKIINNLTNSIQITFLLFVFYVHSVFVALSSSGWHQIHGSWLKCNLKSGKCCKIDLNVQAEPKHCSFTIKCGMTNLTIAQPERLR